VSEEQQLNVEEVQASQGSKVSLADRQIIAECLRASSNAVSRVGSGNPDGASRRSSRKSG
jgi:hypothetical protein